MEIFIIVIFLVNGFCIFWAMIGYPLSLKLLDFILKLKPLEKDYSNFPTVTVLVVAHNEEKVIWDKLLNLTQISYPKDKLKILVSSDNSTDGTINIVNKFINDHTDFKISLYQVKERKGKTNAQNEAKKIINTEFIVLTDANSMFEKEAIAELMATFISDEIAYVCGRLVYTNGDYNPTAQLESSYWDFEMQIRKIESNLQTIVAGNGAIYAVRTKDYLSVDLMESHDTAFPYRFALLNKKALFNEAAIAYEKAGENIGDEFKRKVRMKRRALSSSIIKLKPLNFFKYKWFTYFYIGHRYLRDILWLSHILLLITNIYLSTKFDIFISILAFHLLFYFLSIIQSVFKFKSKYLRFLNYYIITLIAQFVGVCKQLIGKSKPFWDKAESTR